MLSFEYVEVPGEAGYLALSCYGETSLLPLEGILPDHCPWCKASFPPKDRYRIFLLDPDPDIGPICRECGELIPVPVEDWEEGW